MLFTTFFAKPLTNSYTPQPIQNTPAKPADYSPNTITISWKQVRGKLQQIAINDFMACGTTQNFRIQCSSFKSDYWTEKPGLLKTLALDGNEVVGLDSAGNIYFANDINNPVWQQLAGTLKNIDVSNGKMVGVNAQHQLFVAPFGTSEWKQLPGVFLSAAIYGTQICGISSMDRQLFCAENVDKPKWRSIDAPKFKEIKLAKNRMCGITHKKELFCSNSKGINWIQVEGYYDTIDINESTIYRTSPAAHVYRGLFR
eukprot:NODE_171_length_14381_cov_0.662512.p8 type:complete len:256 gc:universal NODE_171_length_14381_cov_0.662512:12585-13352(+)